MTLPNQLTALRILLTPLFAWLVLSDDPTARLWGFVVFIVASLTDLYDGYHARKYGQTTRWGAFMDPLADKILITTAFVYFVYLDLLPLWMVLVVALRDAIVTFLRFYAERKDRPVVTSKAAKIKTALQNVLAYVLLGLALLREKTLFGERVYALAERLLFHGWARWAMLALTLYTVYTGVAYLIENRQTIRDAYLETRSTFKPS